MRNFGPRRHFTAPGHTRDSRDAVLYDGSHSSAGFFTSRRSTRSCPVVLPCVTQFAGAAVAWPLDMEGGEHRVGIASSVKLLRKSHSGGRSEII